MCGISENKKSLSLCMTWVQCRPFEPQSWQLVAGLGLRLRTVGRSQWGYDRSRRCFPKART